MFQTTYQSLSDKHNWGQVALLPWDAEIFGFPVGDFRIGEARSIAEHLDEFEAAFNRWAETNRVQVVACTVQAENFQDRTVLPRLGFEFIDCSIETRQNHLQRLNLDEPRAVVRLALASDRERVEEIGEHAFRFGRYSADLYFPRDLANKRYRIWLRNTFQAASANTRLFIVENKGRVEGFFLVSLRDEEGHITLTAVEPGARGARMTLDLFAGSLRMLKAEGVKKVFGKVSSANLDIANFSLYFEFRLGQPQAIFHWRAPNSSHLVQWKDIFSQAERD